MSSTATATTTLNPKRKAQGSSLLDTFVDTPKARKISAAEFEEASEFRQACKMSMENIEHFDARGVRIFRTDDLSTVAKIPSAGGGGFAMQFPNAAKASTKTGRQGGRQKKALMKDAEGPGQLTRYAAAAGGASEPSAQVMAARNYAVSAALRYNEGPFTDVVGSGGAPNSASSSANKNAKAGTAATVRKPAGPATTQVRNSAAPAQQKQQKKQENRMNASKAVKRNDKADSDEDGFVTVGKNGKPVSANTTPKKSESKQSITVSNSSNITVSNSSNKKKTHRRSKKSKKQQSKGSDDTSSNTSTASTTPPPSSPPSKNMTNNTADNTDDAPSAHEDTSSTTSNTGSSTSSSRKKKSRSQRDKVKKQAERKRKEKEDKRKAEGELEENRYIKYRI